MRKKEIQMHDAKLVLLNIYKLLNERNDPIVNERKNEMKDMNQSYRWNAT